MNKLILSTAAMLLLAAAPAVAADLIIEEPAVGVAPADWGSLYVEFYGGVRLAGTSTYYDTHDEYDMLAGPAFGASVGVGTPVPGLTAGLDLMWTSAVYEGSDDEFLNTFSAMVEAEYAVPLNDTFEIYGAAGLGVVNITYDFPGDSFSDTGAGYQVAVGVRANLLENVAVFAEVKHQDTFGYVDLNGDDVSSPNTNLLVGLRFAM